MKKEVAYKWIEALRSGKYEQGRQQLKTQNDEFCCLGVLCDIMRPADKTWDECYFINDALLPYFIKLEVGMKDVYGSLGDTALVTLNDKTKLSFNEIADIIEENWEKL
jgi:hypothetical protein